MQTLGEICSFYKGNSLTKNDIHQNGVSKCIHHGELFRTYTDVIITDVMSRTNNDGFKSNRGDILIPSWGGYDHPKLTLASVIMEDDVIIGNHIVILRPKKCVNSIFLAYFLNVKQDELIELALGTTVKHIYSSYLEKFKVQIPTVNEQNDITDLLLSLDEKIKVEENILDKSKLHKKYLAKKVLEMV